MIVNEFKPEEKSKVNFDILPSGIFDRFVLLQPLPTRLKKR